MKKSLIALALLAAVAAHAQDSNLTAQSGAASQSQAQAGSQSGALAGATGNAITLNQNTPAQQSITTRAEQILTGHTVNDDNVKYSGTTTQNVVSSGTTNNNVNYSGTQTLKNVPGIAMSGPASGPCTGVSGGISAAGPGFGVGLNGSAVMVDCRLRENTRVLGMAMQSIDGAAYPQERGEVTVMFMDSVRGLAAYNNQLLAEEIKAKK